MQILKNLRIIFYTILGSEILMGAITLFFWKTKAFTPTIVRPELITNIVRLIYAFSAAIVVAVLIMKRKMFIRKKYVNLDEESIIRAFSGTYILLGVLCESISVFAILLFFLTGLLRASLILIAISFFSTLSVFPFTELVKYHLEKIKELRDRHYPY